MPPITSLPFRDRTWHPLCGLTVLQLLPALEDNPASREAIAVASALSIAGARALVACAGGCLTAELQAKGGIFVPFRAPAHNPLALALAMSRLARLIKTEDIGIVHARSCALAWAAYGATRLTKTPFLTSLPAAPGRARPILRHYDSVLMRADIVLADSLFSAASAAKLEQGNGAIQHKIRVIYHGLDPHLLTPCAIAPARVQAVRQQWGVAADERVILVPAAAIGGGGRKTLIEAARLLVRSGLSGVKFIVLGEDGESGVMPGAWRTFAQAGLRNIIREARPCDLPAALLAASVLAVPAADASALGDVMIQALAMGTPVIATNLGAAPEIILAPPAVTEAMRTGFLVPPRDPAALAVAIAKAVCLGASAAGSLAKRARDHALRRFSAEQMCAATLAAYIEACTPAQA